MPKKSAIKRKKNPTIFIPLIIAILVAFFFWNGAEKKANEIIQPVSIPFAAETLLQHTELTKENITFRQVPAQSVPPNVIRDPNVLLGKYVATDSVIPINSMFFEESVVEFEKIPSRISMMLDKGSLGLTMRVNLEKSVANSLRDNMYVQVRFYTQKTPSKQPFEGVLEEKIKILAVRDGQGNDVTSTDEKRRVPTVIVFDANEEQASYLLRAAQLGDLNILALSEKEQEEISLEETDLNEQDAQKQQQILDLMDTIVKTTDDEQKAEQQISILKEILEGNEGNNRTGKSFTGNEVKLFIDSMTHTIEDQFKEGYFLTPKGEIVIYDEELNELRYFESQEKFMGSKYVLSQMTDDEIKAFFEQLEDKIPESTENEPSNENKEEKQDSDDAKAVKFVGKGNDETEKVLLISGLTQFNIKHEGLGTFNLYLKDENGRETAIIKDHKGKFDGQKAVSAKNTGFYVFRVESDGIWEIAKKD